MKKILLFIFNIFLLSLSVTAIEPYNIMEYKKGIYVIEINANKTQYGLVPFVVDELKTNADVYNEEKPKLIVNAGFFDPKNQETVSFVVIDGKTVLNPNDNKNLTENKMLQPYLDKILNRSEFRILKNGTGQIFYDIAAHNDEVQEGFELLHSIQAGPMLYPKLKLEDEFFVLVKDGELKSESASCLHKYARTAIGIRGDRVYLFIATKNNPLTLKELSDITRIYGMEKAMAFDGGGSTSFDCEQLHILSDYDNQGRKLKSFLMLK